MSRWDRKTDTHPICLHCWYASETRVPKAVTPGAPERCCDCGRITRDGYEVTRDPKLVTWPRYIEGTGKKK